MQIRSLQPIPRWLSALALACVGVGAHALSADDARHLLTRTGFGAAPHEIRALAPLSREQAVRRLLDGLESAEVTTAPPAFLKLPITDYLQRRPDYAPPAMAGLKAPLPPLPQDQAQRLTHQGMQEMAQLRVWWLDQMVSTRTPLAERLALFWHGHFTSKYWDVLAPRLLHQQLQTIRRHGHHDVAALLRAMTRDPAMLIFLDNAVNTRRAPNENFARELLELFTLGVGQYRESDIKELARILAGHSVDFAGDWGYRTRPEEFDTGTKTFLDRTGPWTLEDAERILLEHPRLARFIAGKFYREFVSLSPDEAEIERLAAVLRGNRYQMRPFLNALFMSPAFWAPQQRGQLVKSPVELLVGFVRSFGVVSPDLEQLSAYAELLGHELFDPPGVQGWKDGMDWLGAQAVATRASVIEALWTGRTAGAEALAAGPRDLLVRFSAERTGEAPVRLRVRVNGQEAWVGQARWPAAMSSAGQSGPKPAWDLVRVPRAQLPNVIESVEVVFDRPADQPANLFLNWVQVDGKRFPTYLAHVSFAPDQPCSESQVPKGMLYCGGNARFDLKAIAQAQGSQDPTVYDRAHGPVNSIIESATVRLPLAMRPAGLPPAALRESLSAWRSLPPQAALATAALRPGAASHGLEARLKALSLDPAYNLK